MNEILFGLSATGAMYFPQPQEYGPETGHMGDHFSALEACRASRSGNIGYVYEIGVYMLPFSLDRRLHVDVLYPLLTKRLYVQIPYPLINSLEDGHDGLASQWRTQHFLAAGKHLGLTFLAFIRSLFVPNNSLIARFLHTYFAKTADHQPLWWLDVPVSEWPVPSATERPLSFSPKREVGIPSNPYQSFFFPRHGPSDALASSRKIRDLDTPAGSGTQTARRCKPRSCTVTVDDSPRIYRRFTIQLHPAVAGKLPGYNPGMSTLNSRQGLQEYHFRESSLLHTNACLTSRTIVPRAPRLGRSTES